MAEIGNITPNSHKYKEEQAEKAAIDAYNAEITKPDNKKLGPVIPSGKARTKKKSGLSNITKSIISDDAQNVKSYILMDVLIPSLKKAISDIVTNGIDMILYGETGHAKNSNAGRVSYRNYYDNKPTDRFTRGDSTKDSHDTSRNRGGKAMFEDIIVDSRGEAEDILSSMGEYLDAYPVISIADMYDLANITSFPHTYNNYGWKSVAGAKVIPVRDGYLIKMPPVVAL